VTPARAHEAHDLATILVIAICASIAGANDWVAVAELAAANGPGLRRFSIYPTAFRRTTRFGAFLGPWVPSDSRPVS
jgi:hypothetical protein